MILKWTHQVSNVQCSAVHVRRIFLGWCDFKWSWNLSNIYNKRESKKKFSIFVSQTSKMEKNCTYKYNTQSDPSMYQHVQMSVPLDSVGLKITFAALLKDPGVGFEMASKAGTWKINQIKKAWVLIVLVLVLTHEIKRSKYMSVYIQQSKWHEPVCSYDGRYWKLYNEYHQHVQERPFYVLKHFIPQWGRWQVLKEGRNSANGTRNIVEWIIVSKKM